MITSSISHAKTRRINMEKLKNKNTIILIISAVLVLIAIIIAVVATASSNKEKKEKTTTSTTESVSIDLGSIADMNNVPTTKKTQQTYFYEPGKYKIATKDDPLGLRLEPNTTSDRLVYVPKGHEVEVIAVWEDWGYVVYDKTGGWLSMNYLELVSGNKKTTTTEPTTAKAEQ